MSEQINLQSGSGGPRIAAIDPTTLQGEMLDGYEATLKAYQGFLEQSGQVIPEIAEHREAIEAAGSRMIGTYGLQAELFEEPSKALVFTAMASRWSKSAATKKNIYS
jgi:hypothetical protein